ncbi:winged helix-turn-helix domain-containing protein [Caenimonas soli]|uniref:winged helix-turn-helix domain-containing protein n=1 Tax=Caenimonas soli TaxID=2735555 RepID=UPI001554850D|nr:winged helix-turn-helix domain-containing protein [Caenimonas soli]NPC58368.1 tetratricopeptide repeat protein [Caenimonas soli]
MSDRYVFGSFLLERTQQRVLHSDGTPVALTPRLFSALLVFVERSGELLDKGSIMDALWPGLVVEENNLNQVVSGLRRALGDDAHGSRFIETVPRRGFRFVAAVTVLSAGEDWPPLGKPVAASVTQVAPRSRRRRWRAVAMACAAGAGTLLALALYSRSVPPSIDAELTDRRSIAVMPFTDLSEPKAPHVAHAVDHQLTMDLGRLHSIRVISRESSAVLGSSGTLDPKRVGRELGVRHLLTGAVRQEGSSLSVTVRLLRTDTGALLWSDRFDYSSVADWAVQQNILASVGNLLDIKVQQSVLERAVLSPPSSAAVDRWMRGTYVMTTFVTREQLMLARGHFEAALAAQPDSVAALAGLASTHVREVHKRWSADPKRSLTIAKTLARRALAANPDDQRSLLVLSSALNFAGELDDAITTTQRLLQLNPNNAAANRELAISFYFLGRWEDALRQVEVAERLNPLDVNSMSALHDTAATALVALHRYDEAVERSRRGAATNPSNLVPLLVAASAEAHRNNLVAARQQAAEILKRQPGYWVGRDRGTRGSTAPAYVAATDHFSEGLRLAGLPGGPPSAAAPATASR